LSVRGEDRAFIRYRYPGVGSKGERGRAAAEQATRNHGIVLSVRFPFYDAVVYRNFTSQTNGALFDLVERAALKTFAIRTDRVPKIE
jgi:hypothetical protein